MSGLLTAMGPEGTALALLVLGHVLADFAFQTDAMVANKHRWRPLLAHGLVVIATHAVVLAPMLRLSTALIVLAIAVSHVLVDGIKARLRDPGRPSVRLFVGDQLVHLLVLLFAWTQIPSAAWSTSPLVLAVGGVPYQGWAMLTTGAVYISAFVFAHHGANAIVRGVLPDPPPHSKEAGLTPDTREETDIQAGATIGTLERWLVMLLALAGQWGALAIVIAAKSIARFEKLRKRPFAEYFLVGTLTSVLVGIALALSVQTLT